MHSMISPSRRISFRQLRGRRDGCYHTGRFRRALPGAIERRTVCHAGTYDGQAQGNVYRAVHSQKLERDMPLIVIHGDDGVEFAIPRPNHQRIGGEGAYRVDAEGARLFNRRGDDPGFFVAEKASLAAMGI